MESFVSGGGADRSALTASAAIRSQATNGDKPVEWLNVAGSLTATPLEVARRIANPPSIGETIKCDASGLTYTFGSRLDGGEGFFGVVYAATDDFGNNLAIKVLKPKGSYEEDRRAAIREFVNLRAFRHPTIIHVYDAFEWNGLFYIVMERCWRPLTTLFAPGYSSKIWMPGVARCALQALDFIHRHGHVHQDLHLGNVFVHWSRNELVPSEVGSPTFKVGDLGITKLVAEMNPHSTMLAQWMLPPEAIDPSEYGPMDHRVDIYHCALLLLQFVLRR